MSCGPSFTARARKCGSGWPCVGRVARLWPSLLATGAGQPASVYGKRSPKATRGQPAIATSGEAYQEVIPEDRHEATGKEEGETCHVERWINTLRQRISRFVRKTLSFSKSRQMHHCCLKLFIYRYNLERRNIILE